MEPHHAYGCFGNQATKRTRTVNLRITNALLYQLSYGGEASSGIRTPDLRFTKALLYH